MLKYVRFFAYKPATKGTRASQFHCTSAFFNYSPFTSTPLEMYEWIFPKQQKESP